MSSELVERLRNRAESYRMGGPSSEHTAALLDEAAARIEALEADKARLREALAPFAKAADNFDEFKINNDAEWFAYSGIQHATGSVGSITVADLRAARRAREGGNADG